MSRVQFILKTDQVKREMLHRLSNCPVDKKHPWLVIAEPYKQIRSHAQNARYWATLEEYLREIQSIISEASEHYGLTAPEIKRQFKQALVGGPLDIYLGLLDVSDTHGMHSILKTVFPLPVVGGSKTTTALKRGQFVEYTDQIAMELDKFLQALETLRQAA